MTVSKPYPDDAYEPTTGKLWWEIQKADGIKGAWGVMPRMASWLRWNVEIGEYFTTRQLREALDTDHEHAQRRQRELRNNGWEYLSSKEEPSLGENCQLLKYGWWPGLGPREKGDVINAKMRAMVFKRDGSRCVLCGRAAREKYEDNTTVTLTVGHIKPRSQGGRATLDNLRTECNRCNETLRADTGSIIDPWAVVESVKNLKKAERLELLTWIRQEHRSRTALDRIYDDVRLGGTAVENAVMEYLLRVEARGN